MKLRAPLACCIALLLGGCAAWKVDKSVQAAPEQVAFIAQEIEQVRRFQQAAYEVSTFAVDRCELRTAREPFALMTLGHLANLYGKDRIAAYWQAAGLDETWRVLWAAPDSGLKAGERILRINGEAIENNKTGMGEDPLAYYLAYTSRARDAALEGKPYVVTLEDGREHVVRTREACRTQVWAMPLFEKNAYFSVPPGVHQPIVLPSNAIHEARNVDEFRYLAAVAVYLSASQAGRDRARAGRVLLGLGAVGSTALIVTSPLLGILANPVIAALSQGTAEAVGRLGMNGQAALFAAQVVADMGGQAGAGLELADRLAARRIDAPGIVLSPGEQAVVREVVPALAR